jgi:hypothetical protein
MSWDAGGELTESLVEVLPRLKQSSRDRVRRYQVYFQRRGWPDKDINHFRRGLFEGVCLRRAEMIEAVHYHCGVAELL